MNASPAVLASAYSFANQEAAHVTTPPSLLRGRWTCTITEPAGGDRVHTLATGILDLLHAGSYLVGSGWLDGTSAQARDPGSEAALPSAGLEGPLFGAVRGEEIVIWVTNAFRTAMWVLKGRLTPRGRLVAGTAVFTDTSRAAPWSYEARFVLTAR